MTQVATLGYEEAAKIFITVYNNEGAVLEPGEVVEWDVTTTDANQGRFVALVDAAVNVTTGIGGKVAGVVDTTINTASIGRIQVFGPANVRATASIAQNTQVVSSSISGKVSHVQAASQSTLTSPSYDGAVVGWTIEDGPNATNATVHLSLL